MTIIKSSGNSKVTAATFDHDCTHRAGQRERANAPESFQTYWAMTPTQRCLKPAHVAAFRNVNVIMHSHTGIVAQEF